MFLSLLDEARNDEKCGGENKEYKGDEDKDEVSEDDELLEKLSEYLFDIFDANCMEEFHLIERFEREAIKEFLDLEDEYTLKQFTIHQEFLRLFENILERFLLAEKTTSEALYTKLEHYKQKYSDIHAASVHPMSRSELHTVEIIHTISAYTEFNVWAGFMKEQARNTLKFKSFTSKLSEAVGFRKEL